MEHIKEILMYKHMSCTRFLSIGILLCAAMASPLASAQCGCPSDKNGSPKAPFGLGQSFPAAPDMAPHPAWQVYEFERDGVRYLQVNDRSGTVRAAVGQIDGTFWVLPIGTDADRVAVPGDALPAGQPTTTIYRSETLQIIRYVSGRQDRWLFRVPNQAPVRSRSRASSTSE
jgi:hypothetical protein